MRSLFNPRELFLQIPDELLRPYFEERGLLTGFPWNGFELGDVDPRYDAWLGEPVHLRDPVERELRDVAEFAKRDGEHRLIEAARLRGFDIAEPLGRRDGPVHKALWAYVAHRDVFDLARQFQEVDVLHGRFWLRRTNLVRCAPETSEATCNAIGAAVSAYFKHREGCGALCEVHYLLREEAKHCFIGYPEDHPDTELVYGDDKRLTPSARKGVFRVAFVFDEQSGTLDVHARGGRAVQEELQRIFARIALGVELPPESSPPTLHRVHLLKHRDFVIPLEPEDGVELARVKSLRLDLLGRSRVEFDARDVALGLNVYDDVEQALQGLGIPDSNVEVVHATLQFVFKFVKPRVLRFAVTPHSCELRDGPGHAIARRCIVRAGLACA